jgi:hypothetical protein
MNLFFSQFNYLYYFNREDVPDSNQPGFMCVRFPISKESLLKINVCDQKLCIITGIVKLGILLTIKVWQARLIICSIRNGLRKLWSYLQLSKHFIRPSSFRFHPFPSPDFGSTTNQQGLFHLK